MPMTSFHDLSAELVELIATYLDPSTFCTFRLASKVIYDRTYQDFIRRITSLGFFLAPHSLNVLLNICNHEHLAKKFRQLHVGSHTIGSGRLYRAVKQLEKSAQTEEQRIRAATFHDSYLEYQEAQNMYRRGDDSITLAYILAKMTSLEAIQVGEWDGVKQWEVPDVTYYGTKIFTEQTGSYFDQDCGADAEVADGGDWGHTHAFKAVLRALATTRIPIKKLAAGVCERDTMDMLFGIDIAKMPALSSYFRKGLQTSFSTLRILDLAVGLAQCHNIGESSFPWLGDFVNLAVNLQELTLTSENASLRYRALEEDDSILGVNYLLNKTTLPRLTHFTLQGFVINAQAFRCFSLRHQNNISEIGLRRVAIYGASWQSIISEMCERTLPKLCRMELAWLEEVAIGETEQSLIAFDQEGLSKCRKCWARMHRDIDFKAHDCKHTARSITCEEILALSLRPVDFLPLQHTLYDLFGEYYREESDV